MRDKLHVFAEYDAQLIAIDPHESWSARFLLKESGFQTDDVHYPLLMDPTFTVSATYGVAFQMRIHTELSNRPATFLIDKTGKIRYARRGTAFNDRPKPDDLVGELKRLQ